ncbi:unnamed protein product [Amoebophrya sp. A25]|nr:unnamed protein product [Amoebophrya sp. A25]|eukprot:GSA25T00018817001.1
MDDEDIYGDLDGIQHVRPKAPDPNSSSPPRDPRGGRRPRPGQQPGDALQHDEIGATVLVGVAQHEEISGGDAGRACAKVDATLGFENTSGGGGGAPRQMKQTSRNAPDGAAIGDSVEDYQQNGTAGGAGKPQQQAEASSTGFAAGTAVAGSASRSSQPATSGTTYNAQQLQQASSSTAIGISASLSPGAPMSPSHQAVSKATASAVSSPSRLVTRSPPIKPRASSSSMFRVINSGNDEEIVAKMRKYEKMLKRRRAEADEKDQKKPDSPALKRPKLDESEHDLATKTFSDGTTAATSSANVIINGQEDAGTKELPAGDEEARDNANEGDHVVEKKVSRTFSNTEEEPEEPESDDYGAETSEWSDFEDIARNDRKYADDVKTMLPKQLDKAIKLSDYYSRAQVRKPAYRKGGAYNAPAVYKERVQDVRVAAPPAVPDGGGSAKHCILVANLLSTTGIGTIRKKAGELGTVRHVRCLEQPRTGISFGVVVIEYASQDSAEKALDAPAAHFRLGKEQPMVKAVSGKEYDLMVNPPQGSVPWLVGGPCEIELRQLLENRLFGREITVHLQREQERHSEFARRSRQEKSNWATHQQPARGDRDYNSQYHGGGGGSGQRIVSTDLRNLVNQRNRSPGKPQGAENAAASVWKPPAVGANATASAPPASIMSTSTSSTRSTAGRVGGGQPAVVAASVSGGGTRGPGAVGQRVVVAGGGRPAVVVVSGSTGAVSSQLPHGTSAAPSGGVFVPPPSSSSGAPPPNHAVEQQQQPMNIAVQHDRGPPSTTTSVRPPSTNATRGASTTGGPPGGTTSSRPVVLQQHQQQVISSNQHPRSPSKTAPTTWNGGWSGAPAQQQGQAPTGWVGGSGGQSAPGNYNKGGSAGGSNKGGHPGGNYRANNRDQTGGGKGRSRLNDDLASLKDLVNKRKNK